MLQSVQSGDVVAGVVDIMARRGARMEDGGDFTFYTYSHISLVFLLLFTLLCCYPCFYFNNITSGSGVGGVSGGDLNSDGG